MLRLVECKDIVRCIFDYFSSIYSEEEWRSLLLIREENASWLERDFEEVEVKAAIFDLSMDKAPCLDGFTMAFF